MNLLLAFDQLGHAFLGGHHDETISSQLGKVKQAHGGKIPWRMPFSKATDWVLDKIDPNHSIDAIEHDEGTGPVMLIKDGFEIECKATGLTVSVRQNTLQIKRAMKTEGFSVKQLNFLEDGSYAGSKAYERLY